ncbi:MAG: DEAD/DEAH box helicase family protein, partial [Bacteroidales bacterium]|nr:DEAD/DEAH box helicase family protein [Bacteroidales bacterium]
MKKDGTKLRLLIGKDPYIYASQQKNPKVKSRQYPDDYIKTDISKLELKDEYKQSVKFLLDNCTDENPKVEIRIYRTDADGDAQFLHSKCYIFIGNNDAVGIVGSSNFTEKGLQGNAELNYLETNWHQVTSFDTKNPNQKSHIVWFEEKWNNAQPWNKIFLEQILQPSPIAKQVKKESETLSPYEIYIKYLQMQFGDITDESVNAQLKSYLPKDFIPYGYQLDAVKQCFYIMKNHGGFFLSDVVGLGKTVVGVLIIKKFIAEADLWNRRPKVLIVSPPAIKKSWENTIETFDKDSDFKIADNIEFITTGSIGKLIGDSDSYDDDNFDGKAKSSDYGLIIIDESHNFRNSYTQKYAALNDLIDRIQLQTGSQPFVGLLSATPQNNSPQDLKNQIFLFQRSHNSTTLPDIPGGKLDTYFNDRQKLFNEYKNADTEEARNGIKKIAADIHDAVLQYLMVRRTRNDIKTIYADDSKMLKFPAIKGPKAERYTMNMKLSRLFYDTVSAIVGDVDDGEQALGYYRYAALNYLRHKEDRLMYEKNNLKVEDITRRLAHIMQLTLVKRLESSFTAFCKSLENLRQNTKNMIDMLEADTVFICPDIDVNETIQKEGGIVQAIPVIRRKIAQKGGNNREFSASDMKKDEYLDLL